MEKHNVTYCSLEGTYFEMGRQLAAKTDARRQYFPAPDQFSKNDLEEALCLYDTWCPGIREELEGFSQESGLALVDIAYTWMSRLVPRCCGLILTGGRTTDGHTKIARSYEFDISCEDLAVYRTAPAGRYAHVSGAIAGFGRTEGVNEKGLAVSMSSCGMPVGNLPMMRAPREKGLQFWAAIRSLLEGCADVDEALERVAHMPIAYNINLYLADSAGRAALFETMNGKKAYRRIGAGDAAQYLCGTNHIVLKELMEMEPEAMENSIVRYEKLSEFAAGGNPLTEGEIRSFLLKKYPEGMTEYFYDDGFGTIKTVILDTAERRYSICWLGQADNGWTDYRLDEIREDHVEEKKMEREEGYPEFYSIRPIPGTKERS